MSLVPFALRVCVTRALQAALPANVVVVDSPQEPLDFLDKPASRPIVAVYTGATMTKLEGRNLLGGAPSVLLTLQMFLPESFAFEAAPGQLADLLLRKPLAVKPAYVARVMFTELNKRASVTTLRLRVSPPAVLWLVISARIDAIYRSSAWRFAHVLQKDCKIRPVVADLYA